MADRIMNNQFAFTGLPGWHGKGTSVDQAILATMTPEEQVNYWCKTAKVDFAVQRRALAMRNAIGSQDGMLTDPLKAFRAIVRADTDEVYQIASDRYYPMQPREVVDFFSEYCAAGHATMETLGAIDGGRIIFALAKLNGGTETYVGKEFSPIDTNKLTGFDCDELKGYMLLATSYDGSLKRIGKPTQIRVVCWNTLSASIQEKGKEKNTFSQKNMTKWTPQVAEEAKKVMGMAIESVSAMNATAQRLAKVSIDDRGRMEFVKRLLGGESILEQVTANTVKDSGVYFDGAKLTVRPAGSLLDSVVSEHGKAKADEPSDLNRVGKAIIEAMLNSPGSDLPTAKDTLWGAVNGVTYYVDHQRGRTQDNRLAGAWFGTGDTMKQQAVKVAMDFAEGRV